VLLDEIGTGTDPSEGAALAIALLDELLSRGAFCLITTHYHLLKAYGFLRPNVSNVSLEFDREGLTPTFRLTYGKPGVSHALDVASSAGLPAGVIEKARGYLSDAEKRTATLISELEESLERLADERGRVERLREEARIEREKGKAELTKIEREREGILQAEREKAEGVLRRAEQEIRLIKRGLRERKLIETQKLRQLRNEIDEHLQVRERRKAVDRLGRGDAVRVVSLGQEAVLSEPPEGKTRVAVVLGGKRVSIPAWDLMPSTSPPRAVALPKPKKEAVEEEPRPRLWGLKGIQPATREVNLIGLRVEEALPILDKTLDLAVAGGLPQVSVIHGRGTGRLREAVRKHLTGHMQVKAFRPGEGMSAAAVTVVELES
jgi:DNA mismatch repair protein MutS2